MQHHHPAGWHQDPQAPERLRYFDGSSWTEHVAPAPFQAAPHQTVVTNVVAAPSSTPKSVGLAFLLTFLFGPFGLFYVSVAGAIIMVVVNIVGGILTFGVLNLILWPIEMVWAIVAAQNANKAAVPPLHAAAPLHVVTPPFPPATPAKPPAAAAAAPAAPAASCTPTAPPPYAPEPAALPRHTGIEDPFSSFADAAASEQLPPPRPRSADDQSR